ncbi:MAG: tRNA guanosine(34) transglycosylase Tgt, partial [Saprospiraceae bacterium]|nr:tRNA guanosine(34) transglycosylase Tgt [Saprospiraceae bacterium]
ELVTEILPKDKPRYLMGVGTPENILEGIARGIDMFDCVLPTRNARHGMLYTSEGIVNIRNQKWQTDFSPIDPDSTVHTSRTHSRAYLRHLFICNEILGMQLATLQNLGFYLWLVGEARTQILAGTFLTWKNEMVKKVSRRQ